ncbi:MULTISPECIES: hypothetical protein [Legionella]|uniref:Uncharacterized protein n=1 Tax=Legionella drozanskii LLAP-1 TaxID=1212489 RepID=A0A0W0TCA7_9GAMM|nr:MULTISPECIES: hypothetical protein [Legionella]KTC93053.1 hypothetical protein Ldro_0424 [Legionella drozanskii LLAP-1]PJE11957.1 MAG: hypothetical protein CK430_08290 [Legionella sp.]
MLNSNNIEAPRIKGLGNYSCYTYLNRLKTPASVFENIETLSPFLAYHLKNLKLQKNYDPDFCYIELYNQFISVINDNIDRVFEKRRAELLKELASINGRKNFVRKNKDNPEYLLFLKDADEHSTPEYEREIHRQLEQLNQFVSSVFDSRLTA